MKHREKLRWALLLTAAFAALALLFLLFPLTGDDWYREGLGRTIGSAGDLLRDVAFRWKTTNPRILGNVLAYLSGSRPVLRVLLRTSVTLLLMFFAAKAAGLRTKAGFLLLAAGLFALPREMFRQIYPWSAGFFNYVPPVLILLICLRLLRELFEGKSLRETPGRCTALFFLAFAGQLFVEHNTLCAVCAAAALLLWYRAKRKTWSAGLLCFLTGALLGAALLFLSPSYRTLTEANAAYQAGVGGLAGMLSTAKENLPEITKWLVTGCPVLYGGLTLLALAALRRKENRTAADLAAAAALALGAVYSALHRWLPAQPAAAGLWLAALGFAALRWLDGAHRARALFFLFVALAAAVPLTAVTPIGPRCLFTSYVFLLLAGAQFLPAAGLPGEAVWQRAGAGALAAGVFAACVFLFLPMHRTELLRRQAIAQAMAEGEREIVLPEFPHAEYLWDADTQKLGQTYYYESPGDIVFVFVPAEEWTP